ncbi:MAG: type transport system permease protein, partial [Solirubrobacteraceae bacterium]|nr:type transport system permease protein [Solirubrobacteraceae bacterium]
MSSGAVPPAPAEVRSRRGGLADRHRGLLALTGREVLRVLKLWTQTIAAPVFSSFLFVIVFGLSFGGRISQVDG